jgi:hypothetical protein
MTWILEQGPKVTFFLQTSIENISVWNNFFESAGINNLDAKYLAKYPINGRQIRSNIRLAQALAKDEGKELCLAHVERTLKVSSAFQSYLQTAELGMWVYTPAISVVLATGAAFAIYWFRK